jgi:23S rRNA (cytidine1920-2'-O)/16S rRNA (cytidine1409-2'-O)-methyltransferase
VSIPGPTPSEADSPYVGRGGLKLHHALHAFAIDPEGATAADLGCSTGGFTDCLLRHAAAHVHAVDTAYGQFAWKLRQDPRVSLHERTNALHFDPADAVEDFNGVDLVVIDLGWTPQRLALPAAARWLARDATRRERARVISLIKPHYEASKMDDAFWEKESRPGVLTDEDAERVLDAVLDELPALGFDLIERVRSPIAGGGSRRSKGPGNAEWLALLRHR